MSWVGEAQAAPGRRGQRHTRHGRRPRSSRPVSVPSPRARNRARRPPTPRHQPNTRRLDRPRRRRSRQTSTTPLPTSRAPKTSSPFRPPSATKTLLSSTSAPFRTPAAASCERVKASSLVGHQQGEGKSQAVARRAGARQYRLEVARLMGGAGQKKGPLERPPQVRSVAWVSACSVLTAAGDP